MIGAVALACGALGCPPAPAGEPAPDRPATAPTTAPAGFTYTLPSHIDPKDVVGLQITLRVVRSTGSEALYVDLSASPGVGQQPSTRPSMLGSYAVVRPPRIGESLTASVKAPPPQAWTGTAEGAMTVVRLNVAPAHAGRAKPDVEFQVVAVKPSLRK